MQRLIPASAGCAMLLSGAFAAPAAAQTVAQPFLVFEHKGLDSMIVDSRDQGLRRALAMLPDRIGELPSEIDDMPPEVAGLMQLFLRTIAKPARVALIYDGENPTGGFFGYGFVASVECANEAEVEELRDAVLGIVSMIEHENGMEIPLEDSTRFDNMQEMMLPVGLLSFGPRETDNGWRYEIVVGTVNDPDQVFAEPLDLVDAGGFESTMSMQMDFSAMTPLSRIVTNMAGDGSPQVREITAKLEEMGLLGDDALRIGFQSGTTRKMAMTRMVMHDVAERADLWSLPTDALKSSELDAIPSDVFGLTIGRANFSSIDNALAEMAEYGVPVEDALDEFEDMTGVDLVDDILHSLGGTFAFYNAEATGGGSLLSSVVMMTIEDQKAFGGAMHRLTNIANDIIAEEADMPAEYVRFDSWTDTSGAELITLRFPGLPVPLELSMAFTDDWFIAAPTPQAAVAAARQAMGKGDDGLTSNPRFASMYKEYGEGATSFQFIDTPRTIRAGYPVLTLIGSGLSNLVRSPHDSDRRNPGMILPLYHDLANADTVPTMKITRWEGDDLVTTSFADRSLWVQTGGAAGVASAALPLLAVGVGVAAVAGNEMNLGMGDWQDQPMALVEMARRSFFVDPIAEMTAVLGAMQQFGPQLGTGTDLLTPAEARILPLR
ncbi:MAG: hypothetical protein Q9O74_11170 [Planctomycetota bacterium]|nr:hypothetical protein [Planctomycetota bacterium]